MRSESYASNSDFNFSFRFYRRRHHTDAPAKITTSGSMNWLLIRTHWNWALVIVIRRSSGSFGRIEIKSSSDESQFTVFNAKSRFPLKPKNPLAAHSELPITTKRPCEFSLPGLYVPAAPIGIGPFLFFGPFGSMCDEFNFSVA